MKVNMEKEFIPYELAVKLKELGFNNHCLRGWDQNGKIYYHPDSDIVTDNPTFSQSFRWFRNIHNLTHNISDFIDNQRRIEWDYQIAVIGTDLDKNGNYVPLVHYSIDDPNRKFKTYEEAELACLDNLIEIVKSKLTQ